jgi:hypothetical protein
VAEWSEDHVEAIGYLNLNFGTFGRAWLNWRPGGGPYVESGDSQLG